MQATRVATSHPYAWLWTPDNFNSPEAHFCLMLSFARNDLVPLAFLGSLVFYLFFLKKPDAVH